MIEDGLFELIQWHVVFSPFEAFTVNTDVREDFEINNIPGQEINGYSYPIV